VLGNLSSIVAIVAPAAERTIARFLSTL